MKHFRTTAALGVICILMTGMLGACSTQRPQSLAAAEEAIQSARTGRAPQYAPAELAEAEDRLEQAREALENGESSTARRLGEKATVDARYATAKADAVYARYLAENPEQAEIR